MNPLFMGRFWRHLAKAGLLLLFAYFFAWLISSNVNDKPTAVDVRVMESLFKGHGCDSPNRDFYSQLACIETLQSLLADRVPDRRCAQRFFDVEPESFVNRGFGCCFDRARILEKMLVHLGYQVRRVALFDVSQFGVLAAIVPGVPSHATLEVLTERGWMGVDSNEKFMLLTNDDHPLTYYQALAEKAVTQVPLTPEEFYNKDLMVVYGLYSRHGLSHKPMIPGPELNWRQFLWHNFGSQ